nr:hypothetical protein Iba_chr12cCG13260 [Ipomoea batatas]
MCKTYNPLVYEFVATFKTWTESYHSQPSISLTLFKKQYKISVNFTGKISNMHKVYQVDLFHLWNMEMRKTVIMGVVCKRWLTTQRQDNTTNNFIRTLLTRLCEGLGLEEKMRREGRIASMKSITIADLNRAKLTPVEEGEEEEALPTPPTSSMPQSPSHFATVHD